MARTDINIQLPVIENTDAVAVKGITTASLANGVCLKRSAECMRNTLQLHLNTGAAGSLTFKAGGHYPNSLRGDKVLAVPAGISVVMIQDPSQFTTKDGEICIDVSSGLTGTIYATGKPTGIGQ